MTNLHLPADHNWFQTPFPLAKFQGLINVSGFHVEPGYKGRLMFAVYNAGSKSIVLDHGQRLFIIWFADLDRETEDTYKKLGREDITAENVMKIQGEVASPAELKKKTEDLRSEHDKKIHSIEKEQAVTRRLFAAIVLFFIGGAIKEYFDRRKDVGVDAGRPEPDQAYPEPKKVADAAPQPKIGADAASAPALVLSAQN